MSNIRMAYLLVAHKCPEQVNTFIDQLLNYGDCDVYVHVDKKNPGLFQRINEKYKYGEDDVVYSKNRVFVCSIYDVRWGSFEIVKAALELMKMAYSSGRRYTHMYFGSGQDLLVKKGFYEYLEERPETTFIHIKGEVKNSNRESARYRIRWSHKLMVRNDLHLYRFIRIAIQLLCKCGIIVNGNKKNLKRKIHFYEGRTWFITSYKVLRYIIKYIEKNPDYVDFWEDSLASDLMFFQTIIMNSPYAKQVEDELMYVEFGKTFKTNNHPISITKDTVKAIEKGNYYCARKFEWDEDREIIDYFLSYTANKI